MIKKTEIVVDGVAYAPVTPAPTGNRHIVVLDRGWIFVGTLSEPAPILNQHGYRLTNAQNVRSWGSGGFGGLTNDPKGSGVKVDDCADLRFDASAVIFTVPVPDSWNE